jgi:hypothetical protein
LWERFRWLRRMFRPGRCAPEIRAASLRLGGWMSPLTLGWMGMRHPKIWTLPWDKRLPLD